MLLGEGVERSVPSCPLCICLLLALTALLLGLGLQRPHAVERAERLEEGLPRSLQEASPPALSVTGLRPEPLGSSGLARLTALRRGFRYVLVVLSFGVGSLGGRPRAPLRDRAVRLGDVGLAFLQDDLLGLVALKRPDLLLLVVDGIRLRFHALHIGSQAFQCPQVAALERALTDTGSSGHSCHRGGASRVGV